MITREQLASLWRLQALGPTNGDDTRMQEVYFPAEGDLNVNALLDTAAEALDLRAKLDEAIDLIQWFRETHYLSNADNERIDAALEKII